VTKYQVFRKMIPVAEGDESECWEELGEHEGNDGKGAISAAILAMPAADRELASTRTFAATPASSWQVHSPQVKTETKVTF
jgi:hypothetical protein